MNIKTLLLTFLLGISVSANATLPEKIKQQFVGKTILEGHITLKAPDLAENYAMVNIGIGAIQLPSKGTWVTEITFYSSRNLDCPIAKSRLGKQTLAEGLHTRHRLAMNKNTVYAIARLNTGEILTGEKDIKAVLACCFGNCRDSWYTNEKNMCIRQ